MKWDTNAIDSSLNEVIDEGGSLLNQAKAGPFSVVAKALHRTVLIPMQLYLIFVSIEVIDGIFDSIERFYLWHSEFCWKGVA